MRKEKIMHDIALPDNTSAIFFHFNEETGMVEVYLGDFSTDEIKNSDGYQQMRAVVENIENVLEQVIQDAVDLANEEISIEEPQRVKSITGNVYSVNFSKEIH